MGTELERARTQQLSSGKQKSNKAQILFSSLLSFSIAPRISQSRMHCGGGWCAHAQRSAAVVYYLYDDDDVQ